MTYDYKAGKQRVDDILNNKLEVLDKETIPNEDNFTYENAYYGWVTAIFVDIRNSTELFNHKDKVIVSKIIRSFTSEIIEILRPFENLREIGIRGDCVYAIYTTPSNTDEYNLFLATAYINTYLEQLNVQLSEKNYPRIKAGIAMATAKELVIKAGKKGSGINNLVWIGRAVTTAAKLSSLANKNGNYPIIYSKDSYDNFINKTSYTPEEIKRYFTPKTSIDFGKYYTADLYISEYDDWIKTNLK